MLSGSHARAFDFSTHRLFWAMSLRAVSPDERRGFLEAVGPALIALSLPAVMSVPVVCT